MTVQGRSALFVALSLMVAGCGRKGPLIYPDMLVPAAATAVVTQQSGSVVKLQFVLPDKDRGGRSIQVLAGAKISRRTADTEQKNVCSSCLADYVAFKSIYLDHLPAATQRYGNRLILLDSDVSAGKSYSYSIVPFTIDGVEGTLSTTPPVHVSVPIPAPELKIEPQPTEVKVQLSSQQLKTLRLLGYNLYRSSAMTPRSYLPLNGEQLVGGEYIDRALERGVKYRYSARMLLMRETGDVVESEESQEFEVMLKDDE